MLEDGDGGDGEFRWAHDGANRTVDLEYFVSI